MRKIMGEKKLTYYDIEQNLQVAINDGKIIHLISYSMSSDIEQKMDAVIKSILNKYEQESYKSLVYTCVKELAINGTKANLKRIFFEEQSLNINLEKDYNKGMEQYKEFMNEDMAKKYGRMARDRGLYVRITFYYEKEGIRIEVVNNTNITSQEEKRLREKMSKIMQYDSLLDFYMDNEDNTEGAGMGLALITTMLKSENIDPHLFRIMTTDEKTIARIEIPFTQSFVSIREKGKKNRHN